MASTIKPSTFQVRIKEDHVINGIRTVNENLMASFSYVAYVQQESELNNIFPAL